MKEILVINTGGTFSSADSENGLAPALTREEITKILKNAIPGTDFYMEDFCSMDSANILPEDWSVIAEKIIAEYDKYRGIVLIHGTDTMAYTSSMLSYMLKGIPVPVVLTGSQLPIGHPATDAIENFRTAIQMAECGCGGVYLAFNRKIFLGCKASKVRTISFDAFQSINYPPVGELNARGLELRKGTLCNTKDEFEPCTVYDDKVFVLKMFPGISPEVLDMLCNEGYKGVYIEAFGLGGVPFLKKDFTVAIEKAVKRGMIVLIGSQCRYEGSNLEVYETGVRALASGAIQTHDMTEEAAITKLMWVLGREKNMEDAVELFNTEIIREMDYQL